MGTLFGHRSLALEIIKRSDQAKGFELLTRRWVVERTFGWLMKSRRLTRDHERKPSHHEAFVYLAMIGFAARRLGLVYIADFQLNPLTFSNVNGKFRSSFL